MTIPNQFTLMRIILIPFLIVMFYMPWQWSRIVCALIFAFAAVTDWLDGYLARSLKQTSALGRFLDPVADKLIVAAALVLLVSDQNLPYLAIPSIIIIGREIGVSALREWMAELGKRASVAVSFIGKIKTAIQMIAITALLATGDYIHPRINVIGYFLLWIAAILTVWSMLVYLKAAYKELRQV